MYTVNGTTTIYLCPYCFLTTIIIPHVILYVLFLQVAEVLSESKTRLSITGWFHGPSHKQEKYTDPKPIAPKDITEQEFFWWINPTYLDPLTQSEIREKFEESSEISLPDFLITEKYQEMCSALTW